MGFNNVKHVVPDVYLLFSKDKHALLNHAETTSTTLLPMYTFSNRENIRTHVLKWPFTPSMFIFSNQKINMAKTKFTPSSTV